MNGPIVRQYGVPNWDDIFGKKDEKEEPSKEQPTKGEDQAREKPTPADAADRTDK